MEHSNDGMMMKDIKLGNSKDELAIKYKKQTSVPHIKK